MFLSPISLLLILLIGVRKGKKKINQRVHTIKSFDRNISHLHKIMEGLYCHYSLSMCVCLSACEKKSSRTDTPIWTLFLLNGSLLHWLKPYWNWWTPIKGLGHLSFYPNNCLYVFQILSNLQISFLVSMYNNIMYI